MNRTTLASLIPLARMIEERKLSALRAARQSVADVRGWIAEVDAELRTARDQAAADGDAANLAAAERLALWTERARSNANLELAGRMVALNLARTGAREAFGKSLALDELWTLHRQLPDRR